MVSLIVIYVGIKIRSLTKNGSFKNTLSSGHKCVVYMIKKFFKGNIERLFEQTK